MQEEVKHYKVKSLPTQLRPNSVYYVKATSQSAVNTYITDQNGFPFPLLDLTGGGNVGVIQSVTGTGVTGTFSNPIINISTFKSSDSGNLIEISSNDGKLFVKPITSPDGSIDITITASALELQLGVSLQTQIQNALQPGDNVSELINDAGYITLADIPFSAVSATTWTPNHTTATGNPYLAGTIVYYLGHVFQANFNNDSIIPAIGGNLYWTDLGLGYLIDQEQTDWLAVSGSEFIKNKPTNVSSFTNDAGYLTQDNVVEYANLAAFPVTGVIGTIYIALDTGLFYSWNGTTYISSSAPSTGITGVGLTNYVGRWTSPTTIGTGIIRDNGSNVGINTAPNASYRLDVNGNANISSFLYANIMVPSTAIIYDGGGNLGSRTRGGRNVDYFASGFISSHGNITFSDGNYLISGTETARFDTYDRRLGIRTTTPTEALDVNGNIRNRGFYYDETNSAGTAGKILSATATGTQWINSPTIPTVGTWGALNYPTWTTGTPFVKMTAVGTFALDTTTYYPYPTGTVSQYIDGTGAFQTFPTIPTGTVTSVTATSPITSSGGTTPDISTSMATNKLIGRSTAGTGVMEEITIGTGLTLSGGTLNASATGGIPHATALGTDTYTATVTGVTAYNDADAYLIRFTNGNTTGATLNINGLGAIPLFRNNDGPLLGGDILDGGEMLCIYNSTLVEFQVIGISPNSLIAYVTNDDSVTITKGQAVYAFSGTGDRMTVKLANNVGDATSAQTVGLVLSTSIAANQKGVIMMQGLLDGLSILPTATFADGEPIYLGSTPGSITNVKPYAPNHLVYLGVVTTASNGSAGRMYVNIQNGYELDELHNVQAQSPSLNDTLWYDNTVTPAQWKTASIPAILGYTPPNLGLVQAMTQGLQNIF
jgi:hypothetical protein